RPSVLPRRHPRHAPPRLLRHGVLGRAAARAAGARLAGSGARVRRHERRRARVFRPGTPRPKVAASGRHGAAARGYGEVNWRPRIIPPTCCHRTERENLAGSLFRTKSIDKLLSDAAFSGEKTLKRTLGPMSLIALGIGAIIGAGLFVRTAAAIAERSGPSVTLAFIVAGIGCAFAGLCYAEFASMIPIAGSAYTYSYATMGELVAWIIGWDLVLEYAVGAATVAIAWSEYFNKVLEYFGMHVPYEWSHSPWDATEPATGVAGIMNIPAIVILLLLTALLIRGTQESAFVNSLIVITKVSIVLMVITIGWGFINPANHTPLIPAPTTYTTPQGIVHPFGGVMGILGAAGVVFFAFIGFDAVSTAAQEAKHPERDMPIGILGSLVICTVLYVLFSYVLSGV